MSIKAQGSRIRAKKYFFILLAILTIAVFFRFWQLSNIPPGIYPDEAINANQAISSPGKVFYPENNGREGLFINLIFLSFSIFGISIWSFKFVSAIIGTLTVLGLYLLTKEVFQGTGYKEQGVRSIALLSAFFLATSFWHTNFSRISFRAILVPFCLVFLFYFLFRGFRTKKFPNFMISGIFFGLGFYTYIAFRVAIFLVFIALTFWYLVYRKQNLQKKFFLFAFCFLLFAFLLALPILIYFLKNPQDFISRATGISVFAQKNLLKSFGNSLLRHLLMFNFTGDKNWRHNISSQPVLFWPIGILFLIGLVYSTYKTAKILLIRNGIIYINFIFAFLLTWWFIMLLPGILTLEGIPHSLRTIGAIPPTFIFAGLGGIILWQEIEKRLEIKKHNFLKIIMIGIVLGGLCFLEYCRYFVWWGQNPEVKGAFAKDYVEIGNYLNSLPPTIKKYVIVNQGGVLVQGIPMPSQTVEFIERTKFTKPRATYLLPENIEKIKIEEDTVIVPMRYDEGLFQKISEIFPTGSIQKENEIWIYKLE